MTRTIGQYLPRIGLPRFGFVGWALLLALVLGSCASRPKPPPDSVDNICAIFAERPDWRKAVEASALRWGAPVHVQMAILWHESRFRPRARPPKKYLAGFVPWGRQSSAYGYAQAIDSTWEWYRRETGNRRAKRTDFEDAADFVGWYMAKTLVLNGVPMNDAFRQYLAYHEGHTGFRRGDWRSDENLKRVAGRVAAQAARYRAQLATCP